MIPIVSFSIVSIDSVIGYRIFFGFKVEANKKKKKKFSLKVKRSKNRKSLQRVDLLSGTVKVATYKHILV